MSCPGCGSELPPTFLVCPSCNRLVHAEALKGLAAQATAAEQAGNATAALADWRRALDLLPGGSVQHQRIGETVARLSDALTRAGAPGSASAPAAVPGEGRWASLRRRYRWLAPLVVVGLLLLKFKWVIAFLLGKGKLLLLGLAKGKTFLSMAVSIGAYTSIYGWKFAVGLIVSLYIHEMGHVAWLRRYGIAASAPMFIPGVGAFVRLKQHPATTGEDARVGLAGPIWGLGAALAFLLGGLLGDWPSWLATARVGAWVNLFNLLPVWQLDGGRAFAALSRRQRAWIAGLLWALALLASDGLLVIVAIAATARAAGKGAPETGDRGVFWTFAALAASLTALTKIDLLPALP